MISKELLNAVLPSYIKVETEGTFTSEEGFDGIEFKTSSVDAFENRGYHTEIINIYELAHKCKEWAFENNFTISSCKRINGFNHKYFESWVQKFTYKTEITEHDYSSNLSYFVGDIEPEAIFKVCQWILDQSKN